MRPFEFILDTFSHAARRDEGPPPGVPLHVDPWFETDLAAICVEQSLSPIVARSLEALTLPPTISRLTAARLSQHAKSVEEESARRQRVATRIINNLNDQGIDAALMGSGLCANMYLRADLRAVEKVDILIREAHAPRAVAALEKEGFVNPGPSPLVQGSERLLDGSAAADVVRYHQHFAPLTMVNSAGDRVLLGFRVMPVGDPDNGELAWERRQTVEVGGLPVTAVSWEDQLIQAGIALGISGLRSLALVLDVGMILAGRSLDWGYIMARTRIQGVYTPLYCALGHVHRVLNISRVPHSLERPNFIAELLLNRWWREDRIDYDRGADGGRFRYGLLLCGGPLARLRWAWRHTVPRRAWVNNAFGSVNALNWIKFLALMRANFNVPVQGTPGSVVDRAGLFRKKP